MGHHCFKASVRRNYPSIHLALSCPLGQALVKCFPGKENNHYALGLLEGEEVHAVPSDSRKVPVSRGCKIPRRQA